MTTRGDFVDLDTGFVKILYFHEGLVNDRNDHLVVRHFSGAGKAEFMRSSSCRADPIMDGCDELSPESQCSRTGSCA